MSEDETDQGSRPMPKGVRAGMIKVSGKEYLPVPFRLLWMRGEKPLWGISTEIIEAAGYALVRATVTDETSRVIASAHKAITGGGKFPPVEKAETGAMGRALGAAGFGTQFGELDEEEPGVMGGIADSPVGRERENPAIKPVYPPAPTTIAEAKMQFRHAAGAIAPILGAPQTLQGTLDGMMREICVDGAPVEKVAARLECWTYATDVLRTFKERCPDARPEFILEGMQAQFHTTDPMIKWTAGMWEGLFAEQIG